MRLQFATVSTLVLILSGLAHGIARAETMVVIDARGTELRPGQTVDGHEKLVLGRGAKVTLIGQDGVSVRLVGPYSAAPRSERSPVQDTGLVRDLAKLIANDRRGIQSMAATRSARRARNEAKEKLRDAWNIPSATSGIFCLRGDGPNYLRRAEAGWAPVVQLARADGSWRAEQLWARGQNKLTLPGNLVDKNGGVFLVRIGQQISKLELYVVPTDIKSDAHRVIWMAKAGCGRQAIALLDSLK